MSTTIRLSVRLRESTIAATMTTLGVSRPVAVARLRDAYEIALAHAIDGRVLMASPDGVLRWECSEQVAFSERGGDRRVEGKS